jgi:hypothetical protein
MPKKYSYTVYMLTPYATWENIRAASQRKAIAQCERPPEYDINDGPSRFVAIREGLTYTVHFLTPYMTWEHVEATTPRSATLSCHPPAEYDINEGPYTFVAVEED